MNYNNLKLLAFTMAIHSINNPYFMGERRSRNVQSSIELAPMPKVVLHEFYVHGVKIMAKSKKDAIKKYNHKYR